MVKDDVVSADDKALLSLYGEQPGEGLNDLHYRKLLDKAAKSLSLVEPQSLPPTSAAGKYHSLGVYHQVIQW